MKDHASIDADYLRRAALLLEELKKATYRHMDLQPGHRVLDAGCGPGVDTLPMAAVVGETGSVTGVDTDPAMLEEAEKARKEAGVSNAEHRTGDVLALPFQGAFFHGCRAERLLQVLPSSVDPAAVVAELVRVLKPGGRIVLADTDWPSASIDFPDRELERRLVRFFTDRLRPNGYAGRELFRLLREAGLEELRVEVFPMVFHDPAQTPFREWVTEAAVKEGIATEEEAARWLETCAALAEVGSFFSCANMMVVSGRRPD